MNTNLRVKQLQGPQENYVHEHPDPQIEPNPEHGGLRVVDHGKHPLVESHPNHPNRIAERKERRHPEHDSLAALGTPRHEKADKS
jgi:hypothetical protein